MLTSNNDIPFSLNLSTAIDGIIDIDVPLNIKLHRRATNKIKYKLYDFVPPNLFKFIESLNYRATELQCSNNVGIMMIPKNVLDANTFC